MSDTSARLSLPYLMPSQAQKHVTVNEALTLLDALVQLRLTGVGVDTPPATPSESDVFAVGAAPTGLWTGQAGNLAVWDGAGWIFVAPGAGWMAYDVTSGRVMSFLEGDWVAHADMFDDLGGLGIGTDFDATNKLAVAADATLLTHSGSGHQLKINKAADGDTASLLFQSNWVGHAEMGLAGDTSFSIKVSPNGGAWVEALRVDPLAQTVSFAPSGTVRAVFSDSVAQIDQPITGSAVQSDVQDTTAGRLMPVGAFGLGGEDLAGVLIADGHASLPSGFFGGTGSGTSNFPGGSTEAEPFLNLNCRTGAGTWNSVRMFFQSDGAPVVRTSQDNGASWPVETKLFGTGNLLAPVSMAGGVPTGGVVEYGTDGQGDYVRFADGTQICTRTRTFSVTTVPAGALHVDDSSFGSWVFGHAFVDVPVVNCQVDGASLWANCHGASTSAVWGLSVFSATAISATNHTVRLVAHGRWI